MIRRPWVSIACAALVLGGFSSELRSQAPPSAASADTRNCLHDFDETPRNRTSRQTALRAVRLINTISAYMGSPRQLASIASDGRPPEIIDPPTVPAWWSGAAYPLSSPPLGRKLRLDVNDVPEGMKWGSGEPLPGWRIDWVLKRPSVIPPYSLLGPSGMSYLFSLTDSLDPCSFTYSSTDPDVKEQPKPPTYGVVPL